ncbi:kinase-like protein [Pyrenochaeta sp. DS3sAY3a]|nr:kinase-like protein [Pyrenochaeta sp. DS3sAY3a]
MEWLNYWEDEDFKCHGHPEPHARAQYLLYTCKDLRWHVKILFLGELIRNNISNELIERQKSKSTRRRELQDLIKHISLQGVSLIENTVTEIRVQYSKGFFPVGTLPLPLVNEASTLSTHNAYQAFTYRLCYSVKEDPNRVIYPEFFKDTLSTPLLYFSKLKELAPATKLVYIKSEKKNYVFKAIDRPLYQAQDSAMVEKEIQNLQLLSPCPAIVELHSVVRSPCPYYTGRLEEPKIVVRGFLMEYYERGSIQDILDQHTQIAWQKWPLQIATGLQHLHIHGITHMDLKPSNVMVDHNGDAKLIDLSGMATTAEWTAPELRKCLDPTLQPWTTRVRHDIWAFGMLVWILLKFNESGEGPLFELVKNTTKENPEHRISLDTVLLELWNLAQSKSTS